MFYPRTQPWAATATTGSPLWEIVADEYPLAVDLDTLKKFLNIPLQSTYYDAEKTALAHAAQMEIEKAIWASLAPVKWVGYLAEWHDQIRIDKRPFRSVVSVEYVDPTTGTITTLDPSTYIVGKLTQKCGVISRGDGVAWPNVATRWDAIRITVLAGYDNADSSIDDTVIYPLPDAIRQALLITTGAIDRSRGDQNSGGAVMRSVYAMRHQKAPSIIPMEAQALLSRYKFLVVGAM